MAQQPRQLSLFGWLRRPTDCRCHRPKLLLAQSVMQSSLEDSWLRAWVDGLYATIKCQRKHLLELRLENALLKSCGVNDDVLPPQRPTTGHEEERT